METPLETKEINRLKKELLEAKENYQWLEETAQKWQTRWLEEVKLSRKYLKEIQLRKQFEGFLKSVIRGGESLSDEHDFEWFCDRINTKN